MQELVTKTDLSLAVDNLKSDLTIRLFGLIVAGTAALFIFATGPSIGQESPLIRLPKQATSPVVGLKNGMPGYMGKEMRLDGWLVLNGARFRNVEFPELAKSLAEAYAQQGFSSNDPEFTQLPVERSEANSKGQIVRGIAICPSHAVCGDLVGAVMRFDLESSL